MFGAPPSKRRIKISKGIIKPKNNRRNVREENFLETFFVKILVVELDAATNRER